MTWLYSFAIAIGVLFICGVLLTITDKILEKISPETREKIVDVLLSICVLILITSFITIVIHSIFFK